ncbi:hypothetical protein ACFP4H_06340 [Pseudophaeobacter arcticus]|uniref:hypothetical protein n=1 Tax=Pseudophaeobacter arcticus TaxID=385492 RepID=UPI001379013D|nr:hypothetical protein [Pseudophaeobacter arcticus]
MYRLYRLISEKAAHGKIMRRPFSFSKQIKPLHEGKEVALGGENFSTLLFMSYIIVIGDRRLAQSPFFIGVLSAFF